MYAVPRPEPSPTRKKGSSGRTSAQPTRPRFQNTSSNAAAGSEAWRALDERAGRLVRLERMQLPEKAEGVDRTLDRLARELDAAIGVDHPNVARLFGSAIQGLDVLIFAELVQIVLRIGG